MVNKLTADQKQSVLQPLALDLTCRKTLKFTLDEVRPLLTQKLAALANVDWTPEQFMRHLRDVDALIAKEQEDVFEFAHRSFQEYLAATEIKDDKRRESLLIEALQAPDNLEWWADTMRLYAAQTDTSQLIAAALKQPTLEILLLAIDFWQTGLTLQDQTVKAALFAQLNQPLKVLDEPTRTWAQQAQPRYFKLAYCLQQQRWKEADIETYWVMVAAGDRARKGYLSLDDIRQFPCEDLRVVDQLWVRYSQGIWGFSIQKQIYADCGATLDGNYPGDEIWYDFSVRVGWRKDNSDLNYSDLTFDLPISPAGEFPCMGVRAVWMGVSSLASRLVNCSR